MKEDGLLMHKNKVYVLGSRELRNLVLKEMHNVPYAKHIGYQKKIVIVKSQLFLPRMKNDVFYCISRCMEC